jgi:hypothetical protein
MIKFNKLIRCVIGSIYNIITNNNKLLLCQATFNQFTNKRAKNTPVTSRDLQIWAIKAARELYPNFKFQASSTWLHLFKTQNRICSRKICRYVSKSEQRSFEELEQTAATFRKQVCNAMRKYDEDYVLNSDQTGCEYRSDIKRTLTFKSEKTVKAFMGDRSKVTHSYTAQYTFTRSGKLLPVVYLCMQEPAGQFGPRVQDTVSEMEQRFKNVVVTSSKSGKLTTNLYINFLNKVIKPYVENNNFLFIIDSWKGQTNKGLYDDRFVNDDLDPTCEIKVIPPGCTPLCQPCDVYFYRQVKYFIKRIQNANCLLESDKELHLRGDAVQIHSVILKQLCAPAFQPMLEYAWYASGLTDNKNKPNFQNVKQLCFPDDTRVSFCNSCESSSFARCAWCSHFFCFVCFYDKYHDCSNQ